MSKLHIFWLITLQSVHSANIWSYEMNVKSSDWSLDSGTYEIWENYCPKSPRLCWALQATTAATLSRTAQTTGYSNVQLKYSYSAWNINGKEECTIDYSTDGVNYVNIETVTRDVASGDAINQIYTGWGSVVDNLSGYGVTIRLRSSGGCYCFFDDVSLIGSTANPTRAPTKSPTPLPTAPPSRSTTAPTKQPTAAPTTREPSLSPTPDEYDVTIWNDVFNGYSGWLPLVASSMPGGVGCYCNGRCPNQNSCLRFWSVDYYYTKSVSSISTYSRLRFRIDIGSEGAAICRVSYKFDSGNWIQSLQVTNPSAVKETYQSWHAQTFYIQGSGTESTLTIKLSSHSEYRSCYWDNAVLKGIIRTDPPTMPSIAPTAEPSTAPTPHPWPVPIWEDTFTDSWDDWTIGYLVAGCVSKWITSEDCPNPGDEPCAKVLTHCYEQPVWITKTADVSSLALLRLEVAVGAETFQEMAKCEIWYKYNTGSWLQTNTSYGDHTAKTYYDTVKFYPHEMVVFEVPEGATTITVKLQSNTMQSHPTKLTSRTDCYWDNVILRGKVRSTTPTSATLEPTKRPSLSPTKKPTNDPTNRPTKSPNTIPTQPTSAPTDNPSATTSGTSSSATTSTPSTSSTASVPSSSTASPPSSSTASAPSSSTASAPSSSTTSVPSASTTSPPFISTTSLTSTAVTNAPSFTTTKSSTSATSSTTVAFNFDFVLRYTDKPWSSYYHFFLIESQYAQILNDAVIRSLSSASGHSAMYSDDDIWQNKPWNRAGIIHFDVCRIFSDIELDDDDCREYEANAKDEYVSVAALTVTADEGVAEYVQYLREQVTSAAFYDTLGAQVNDALNVIIDGGRRRMRSLLTDNNFEVVSIVIINPLNDLSTTQDENPSDKTGDGFTFLLKKATSLGMIYIIVVCAVLLLLCCIPCICIWCCCKKRSKNKRERIGDNEEQIEIAEQTDADKTDLDVKQKDDGLLVNMQHQMNETVAVEHDSDDDIVLPETNTLR